MPEALLAVRDLEAFYGDFQALFGVSIEVARGEAVAVIGASGAGKSTLLKSIAGLLRARADAINFAGEPIGGMPAYAVAARGIALMPEGRALFPSLTVEENLRIGLEARTDGVKTIPKDIYELFPVLWDMRSRMGGDLSGGQQQQLAIARALVTRPKLLILDEPTEGIQPSIIKDIERVIRALVERGTMAILLVEQYFDFARDLAAAYLVMQRGEVVLSGRRDEMDEIAVRSYLTV